MEELLVKFAEWWNDDNQGETNHIAYTDILLFIKEQEEEPIEYDPYFGWCDVDGCENEGCCGGICWSETGYWIVCYFHSQIHSDGEKQPKMKQSAIDRENSRNKLTRYLT